MHLAGEARPSLYFNIYRVSRLKLDARDESSNRSPITRYGWPFAIIPSDPKTAALTFADRLARENGWSAAKAARVVDEYRRFCFLAATAGHEVTPSDAVDQAWHLHLTYSRDYWERFCPEVLGRPSIMARPRAAPRNGTAISSNMPRR